MAHPKSARDYFAKAALWNDFTLFSTAVASANFIATQIWPDMIWGPTGLILVGALGASAFCKLIACHYTVNAEVEQLKTRWQIPSPPPP